MNSFVTVGHLDHNADLDGGSSSVLRSLGFLAAQAGIAGPLIFGLVIVAVISLWRDPACRFWIALAAPALLVISAQAYFSTANANWAVASWPPLVVLVAHFLAAAGKAGGGAGAWPGSALIWALRCFSLSRPPSARPGRSPRPLIRYAGCAAGRIMPTPSPR